MQIPPSIQEIKYCFAVMVVPVQMLSVDISHMQVSMHAGQNPVTLQALCIFTTVSTPVSKDAAVHMHAMTIAWRSNHAWTRFGPRSCICQAKHPAVVMRALTVFVEQHTHCVPISHQDLRGTVTKSNTWVC